VSKQATSGCNHDGLEEKGLGAACWCATNVPVFCLHVIFLLIVASSTRLLQIDLDVFLQTSFEVLLLVGFRCYRQKMLCVLLLIAELLCQLKFAVVR
jgi:hypothetical protein